MGDRARVFAEGYRERRLRRAASRVRRWVAAAAIAVGMLGLAHPARGGVGDPVHNFSLGDLDNKLHTPEVHKGKVLILFFLGHN